MMEEIYFEEDARNRLLSGINKLHRAVASTFGPDGKTVIITNERGEPYATKDGVSVAKSIAFKDPIENIGASLIKQVAEKTVNDAGDGTTTSIILATAFINNLKEFKSKDINKAFDEIIPKVIEQLKLNSRKLEREDIKYVASISANNDIQIGNIIQQAYNHSNIVKVEESNNSEDSVININGMQLNVSYFSKHFINNRDKGECDLNEPYVLIVDGKIESLLQFENPITEIAKTGKSLLVIAEDISENVLRLMESNVISNNIKLCAIKTPGFSKHRKDLLNDISKFTDGEIINHNKPVELKQFGILESCKITKHNSILIKDESINVDNEVLELCNQLLDTELSQIEKDLLNQRIEYLSGNVSIIKVGGGSELEMKERKDRYDDAVLAVGCALEEGIVEGGGIALFKSYFDLNNDKNQELIIAKLLVSLIKPYSIIFPKSNMKIDEEIGTIICFDLYINMFDQNIIDPLKVTRCALENAVSIAKLILSTDTVVLNEYQWN